MAIIPHIRSLFRRRRPRPAPQLDYLPESCLPDDPAELLRAGVIRPWRTEAHGEPWYVADPGAIAWYIKSFGRQSR